MSASYDVQPTNDQELAKEFFLASKMSEGSKICNITRDLLLAQ
jgi:hypothetical protein